MTYRQEIDLFVKNLDALAAKKIAERARVLRDEMEREGASLSGTKAVSLAIVDGVEGAPLEEVKPEGVIRLEFDYRIAVVEDLFLEAKVRAPHLSGEYARRFVVQVDGQALPYMTPPTREQLKDARVVTFTNDAPYARKLEVGKDREGRPFVKQAAPNIIERAGIAVRRKWEGLVKANYTFVTLASALRVKRVRLIQSGERRRRTSRELRYPAIELRKAA